MTADDERRPPPWGPLPGLETPFLDHEPPAGQRAEPWQARLGELEAEAAFASAFDLPWAQPGPGERERAEELGGEFVSPGAFELEEAGIIDGDNRLRVKNATGVPWRWICKIDVADSRGRPAGAGTGLLISNRHVLTAAHVVHDAYKNMQQYTITVFPALDDLDEPFGRYALASKARIRQEYDPTAADSLDWDYALLTLGSAVGEQRFKALNDRPLCFWGSPQCGESTMLARLDPGELNGKAAYTAGYPGGKGGRQLWCAAGILHGANEKRRTMYTTADTTRGQSGSPVWIIDNKRHCLVGIAAGAGAGAGTGSNRIVRVTRELVRQLRAWITEGGETPAMVETEEALEPPVLLLPQPEAPPLDEQPTEQRFDPTAVPKDVAAEPWRALTEADNEFFALTGEDLDAALESSGDPAGQESADVDEFEDPGELEEPDEFEEPAELEELEKLEAELDDLPGQELEEPADVSAGKNGADSDSRPPAASPRGPAAWLEPFRVGVAVAGGQRDENALTDLVFFSRHPELRGRKIRPNERTLASQWREIRDGIIRPVLAHRVPTATPVPLLAQERSCFRDVNSITALQAWERAFLSIVHDRDESFFTPVVVVIGPHVLPGIGGGEIAKVIVAAALKRMRGITVGTTIWFDGPLDTSTAAGLMDLVHEATHSIDYDTAGIEVFLKSYVHKSVAAIFDHDKIPDEVRAIRFEQAAGKFLQGHPKLASLICSCDDDAIAHDLRSNRSRYRAEFNEVLPVEPTTRPAEQSEALTGAIRAATDVPGSQLEHQSTESQVRVALAGLGGAPIQTICGFFDTAGNLVRESDLRTAVVNVCSEEHSKWNTGAGAKLVEGAPSQLPYLVCYSLGGLTNGIPPRILRALQTTATTINYGKLPTYGASERTIEAWAQSVQPAFIAAPAVAAAAAAVGRGGSSLAHLGVLVHTLADLGVLVHNALVFAIKCALEEDPPRRPPPAADLTTFFWSSVFVTDCVRRAGIDLNLENDRSGTHEGRDALLQSTKAHREYVLEAYRRRFGPGQRDGTYHAFEPSERAVQVGDVIIQDRTKNLSLNSVYRFGAIPAINRGRSLHGDIVVEVTQKAHYAETIGGNVGESVTRRRYPLDATGQLVVDRTQSFTQENNTGNFPKKFPGPGNTSGPLHVLSTARIFALLSPEQQCKAVLGQRVEGGVLT